MISTHTPLAGRDSPYFCVLCQFTISTHTPLAGRDGLSVNEYIKMVRFQLTRPSRGVTLVLLVWLFALLVFQLTRPSRGVTSILQR